jgi:sugar phosphate isomerase/epimerase
VRYLQFADALGASGVIALPLRPPLRLPDLSPVGDENHLITQMLLASLRAALERTEEGHAAIFLEPLNRYEARYLRTIGHAAELCEQVDSPRVKVMADLFHMNIEEANPAQALKEVSTHVGHVHLADSQRLEPGKGHLNLVSAFRALREIGFENWFALECGLSGEANEVLPPAVNYIHQCWDQAEH